MHDVIPGTVHEERAQLFDCSVKLLDNIEFLDQKAFTTDTVLMKELLSVKRPHSESLGIVLISHNTECKLCGGKLNAQIALAALAG